jgi:tape measure domain-containing protein
MGFRETLELVVKLTDESSRGVSRVIRNIRKVEASVGSTSKTFAALGSRSTDSYRALETATRRAGRAVSASPVARLPKAMPEPSDAGRVRASEKAAREVARINAQTARQAVQQDALRMRSARTLAAVQVREQRLISASYLRTQAVFERAERGKVRAAEMSSARRQATVQRSIVGAGVAGAALTAGVTMPLIGIAKNAIQAAATMDSLERGLTAINGGNVEKTTKKLEELRNAAKLPGLGFREAIVGQTNLQAAGIEAGLATRLLKGFGNALATVGKGKAELDGVQIALSQIASKGKVSAEEINQLAERVPQIRKVMEAAFGTADTEKLQKKGIGAQTFLSQIAGGLEKLPPVSGGAQNSFENLADSIDRFNVTLGKSVLPGVIRMMERAEPVVNRVSEAFARLSPTGQNVALAVAGILVVLGPLTLALAGVALIATTLGAPITIGLAVAALAVAWTTNFAGIRDATYRVLGIVMPFIQSQIERVRAFIQENGPLIAGAVQNVTAKIQAIWARFGPYFLSIVRGVWEAVKFIAKNSLEVMLAGVKVILQILNGDWEGAWNTVKETTSKAIAKVVEIVGMLREKLTTVLASIAVEMYLKSESIGHSIVSGIASGITNQAYKVWDATKFVATSPIIATNKILDIKSPSKVFAGIGRNVTAGLAAGILAGAPLVTSAMALVAANQLPLATMRVAAEVIPPAVTTLSGVQPTGLASVRQPAAVQESPSTSLSFSPSITINGAGGNAVEMRAQIRAELERHEKELWRRFEQVQARRRERT